MFKLPVRTWILNAAASGRHGAVSRQADQAGCSRQTAFYEPAEVKPPLTKNPPD